MTIKQRHVGLILTFMLCIFVADQVTKSIVRATIPANSVSWAGRQQDFFWFTHERNEGLVGGAFRDYPALALSLSLGATLILVYLYRHLQAESVWQSIAYGLVAGGAAGNLIDRVVLGSVTDFLQVHFYFIPFEFPWKRYPAFNIADSAICIGVFLLLITWRHKDTAPKTDAPGTA